MTVMNLTATIGLEEVIWTVVAAVGTFYVWGNRKEALLDQWAVKKSGKNGVRKAAADHAVYVETAILKIEVIFLVVGLIAMTRVQTASVGNRVFLAGLLILASWWLTRLSIRNRDVRRKLADALDAALQAESLRTAKALMAEDIEQMKADEGTTP